MLCFHTVTLHEPDSSTHCDNPGTLLWTWKSESYTQNPTGDLNTRTEHTYYCVPLK